MSKRVETFTRDEILDMMVRMVILYMDSEDTTPESTGRLGTAHAIAMKELTDDKSFHLEYGERAMKASIDLILAPLKAESDSA